MSDKPQTPGESRGQPQFQTRFEAPADRERRNWAYRWLIHLGLPLSLSLVLHALILIGAAFYTFKVQARSRVEVGEYEAGVIESPNDRISDAFQWTQQVKLDAPEIEPLQDANLRDFSRVDSFDPASLKDTGGPGAGNGTGDGLGLGEGRFSLLGTGEGAAGIGEGGFGQGMGGRGGRLGQAGMWDVRIRANKIVYVVDYSGSLLVAVDDLKRELKRSIGQLSPSQAFDVIVFYSEGTGAVQRSRSDSFKPQLQPAVDQARKEFFQWIDRKSPMGDTEPLPSIKRALAMKPEAVFFFSDGLFEDTVVDEITKANRSVGTKLICFVFDEILLSDMSGMPRETDGARRMRRIADLNNGQVKIVTGKDIGRK